MRPAFLPTAGVNTTPPVVEILRMGGQQSREYRGTDVAWLSCCEGPGEGFVVGPFPAVMQRANSHDFALIKADKCGVDRCLGSHYRVLGQV